MQRAGPGDLESRESQSWDNVVYAPLPHPVLLFLIRAKLTVLFVDDASVEASQLDSKVGKVKR